jgi:hypothetical protein
MLARKLPQLHAHLASLSVPPPAPADNASDTEDDDDDDAVIAASVAAPPEADLGSADAEPAALLPHILTKLLVALVGASPAHLHVDAAARVADVALLEGSIGYERAAVGVLARLEGRLYSGPAEVVREVEGWCGIDGEELVDAMREMV